MNLYRDPQGNFVEVIEESADTIKFTSQGGGFVRTAPRAKFDEMFEKANLPGFHQIKVAADWLPENNPLTAYSTGALWNGWATPYFTFEVAQELTVAMPNLRYDETKDAFVHQDSDYPEEGAEYPANLIQVGGEAVKAYPIGAYEWCWDTFEEEL